MTPLNENIWRRHFLRRKISTTAIYSLLLWEAGIILISDFYLVQVQLGAERLDDALKSIVDGNEFQVYL